MCITVYVIILETLKIKALRTYMYIVLYALLRCYSIFVFTNTIFYHYNAIVCAELTIFL